jgi:hypothetical protein
MNEITAVKADHGTIYAALAAAQMQMGKALKDTANPHFKSKYADLASVMDACMGALNINGICVYQPTVDDETGRYVETVLAHVSGETLKCRVPLIVQKSDMQGYGSAVTYARRYGLMSMAGIAPEDDDGNAAAKAAPRAGDVVEQTHATPAQSLDTAWRDGVLDSLPANATDRQKAEAFAAAIIADFKVKGVRALDAAWGKRERLISSLEQRHPDLHEGVVDAYEMRKNEITDNKDAAE